MQITLKIEDFSKHDRQRWPSMKNYHLQHYKNGEYLPDRTYFTNDKADAILTLNAEALLYEAAGYKRQLTYDNMTLTLLKQ